MMDRQIDVEKKVEEVKASGLNLPAGYVWSDVNISDDK